MKISEELFEALEAQIDFCIDNIRHPDCNLVEAGRFYEEASEHLRAHAILRILIDANAKGFSNDLVMSGHARRAFLRRCRATNHWNYYSALGRSGALSDAVAAGDFDLAREVFLLSQQEMRSGDEYEDDFCFNRFMGLCVLGAGDNELDALLARYESAAEGDASARFEFCRALRNHDGEGLDEATRGLIRARQHEIEEERLIHSEDLSVAIGCYVFVEGVALLKLARRRGLPVALEYPLCPAMSLGKGELARPVDEFATP